MDYRRDITGLRSIAVLIVVLFHLQLDVFSGGFVGVDVFFVISGFLLTQIITAKIEQRTFSFLDFYKRRIRRLFPALFITILASAIAAVIILPPDYLIDFSKSAITALLSASNIYFWLTSGYFDTDSLAKPLLHTWSLSVEEQFYLAWPLLLLIAVKLRRFFLGPVIILGLAFIGSLGLSQVMTGLSPDAAFYLLPFRVFEFAAGGLIGFLPAMRHRLAAHGLSLIGFAGILIATFVFTEDTSFPGLPALLPTLGTAALIYAGKDSLVGRALSFQPFVYVGEISYALYLTHWPIIILFGFASVNGLNLSPLEQAALFSASLGSAVLLHTFVERPFRLGSHRFIIARQAGDASVFAAFAVCIAALSTPMVYILNQKGLPDRFDNSEAITALLSSVKEKLPKTDTVAPIAENAPNVLLVGDSHAGVLGGAFEKFGAESGINIRTEIMSGCAPLMDTYTIPMRKTCNAQMKNQLPELGDDLDLIILSARWGLYTSKTTWGKDTEFKINRSLSDKPRRRLIENIDISRRNFVRGLTKLVEHYSAKGIQVLFVGQVPPIGEDPDACIAKVSTVLEVLKYCNARTYEQAMDEIAWTIDAAKEISGLEVYDPRQAFCPEVGRKCHMISEGKMLYQDNNHLNDTGAVFLLESGLADKIKAVLAEGAE